MNLASLSVRATGARGPARLTRSVRLCVRSVFRRPRFPWPVRFPPRSPPPRLGRCSTASQVLPNRPTSHDRASRDYRRSVPRTTRPTITTIGRSWDLPVLSMKRSRACTGSPTPRGPLTARENAASGIAFRRLRPRRHPNRRNFEAQYPACAHPCPTLRCALAGRQRMVGATVTR